LVLFASFLRLWLSGQHPEREFNFIEQYADDLEVILTHICIKHQVESVDVAAISMGALVVWAHFNRYAHSEPQSTTTTSRNRNSTTSANNQSSTTSSSKSHSKIKRYLNIDQSPIVHNQPDWQGGVFGDKQAQIFEQFSEVLQATLVIEIAESGHAIPLDAPIQFSQVLKHFLQAVKIDRY